MVDKAVGKRSTFRPRAEGPFWRFRKIGSILAPEIYISQALSWHSPLHDSADLVGAGMTVSESLAIKDIQFTFAYVRPRALLLSAIAVAAFGFWLGFHPDEIGRGHATGGIDLFLRSLPLPIRGVVCSAMAVCFLWGAYVTYWPCIRDGSIVIFDGRSAHGYGFWGQKSSVLRSEIEAVSYRYGGASIRTGESKIWIPISMLNTSDKWLSAVRAFLDNIVL